MKHFFCLPFILVFLLAQCSWSVLQGQRHEVVYYHPHDSTRGYFHAVLPEGRAVAGILILMPSLNETPSQVVAQTRLPEEAAARGLVTVVPMLGAGNGTLGVQESVQRSLDTLVAYVLRRYRGDHRKLYMGGFSAGGTCVIKYAQRAHDDPGLVRPDAVFAIDPPLDFERLHGALARNIRMGGLQPPPVAKSLLAQIESEFGGPPARVLSHYRTRSPYSFSDVTQFAIKRLVRTPIRLICEPDIAYVLQQYRHDYHSMNVIDCAAAINELRRLGNGEASLVVTEGTGRSVSGNRVPHSWTIANPEATVSWLLQH